METPHGHRRPSMLVGIGLVLVGLLAGILAMLFVMNRRPASPVGPPVVERVELGVPRAARSDTSAPVVMADAMTLNRLFKDVAGRVTPSVVYIQVTSGGDDGGWFRNFDNRFQDRGPRQSVGSGVIIGAQGYIVTNHHVVEDADEILVTLPDKRQFEAQVVGIDPNTDLAVIKIEEAPDLPVIVLGNSDEVEVGEWVLAVGNPFRLTSTVTAGIVSALGRQVNIIGDTFGVEDFIQTDAAINPGNSGGALVNLAGELVGISTAIATESGSYEGYGFAVPVNLMERIVRDLIAYGTVQRGYLGVQIGQVDAYRAEQLGMAHIHGVYLDDVLRGGAAFKAGLRSGDVVLSIDDVPVDAPNELQTLVARHRPGDRLSVEVWRGGQRRRFEVVLFGEEDPAYADWFDALNRTPEAPPATPEETGREVEELAEWGVGLQALGQRERQAFDVQEGVYVAYVEHGSLAAVAGLPRDVVLLQVGPTPVGSVEDAREAFASAAEDDETVIVRVKRRDGVTAFFEVVVPEEE